MGGFDLQEWAGPLEAPPTDFEQPTFDFWDELWCPECGGYGYIKLSWYPGFNETKEWIPCSRCKMSRTVRVQRTDLAAFAAYVPSWKQPELPDWLTEMALPVPITLRSDVPDTIIEGATPACSTIARLVKMEATWQRLLAGETVCFAPNVDDHIALGALAIERGRVLIVERSENGVNRCHLEPNGRASDQRPSPCCAYCAEYRGGVCDSPEECNKRFRRE